MNLQIAAVVVTYNRLEYLKKCIDGLRCQTYRLKKIIVINNSSNDGTLEWLGLQNDLLVITQDNQGGAGGFNTGIRLAYEKGYQWVWCLDDDGFPTETCLETLIIHAEKNHINVISPIPLDIKNPQELAFYTPLVVNSKFEGNTWKLLDILKFYPTGVYHGWACFFNGVLLERNVIKIVGFPKKELFIWGDEIEYFRRIIKHDFQLCALVNAKYFHPANKWKPKVGLFHRLIYDLELDWRAYYFFRNHAYLSKDNYRFYDIKFVFAQIFFFLNKKNKIKSIKFLIVAYWDGITNNFSKKIK